MEETIIVGIPVDKRPGVHAYVTEGGLALGCGLLLGACFRLPALAPVAWVALVPLLVALRRASLGRAVVWGLVAGATLFGILLYWSAIFGGIALVGLVGYTSAWVALFAAGVRFLRRARPGWRVAGTAALFVAIEYVRSWGPYGFPWGILGYSQQPTELTAQFASVAGVFGLSAAVVVVNACLAEIATTGRQERVRVGLRASAGAAATIAVVLAVGFVRTATPLRSPTVPVAGVQPSIDQWAKFDASKADVVMRTMSRLTHRALRSRPALLIWPETVVPVADAGETSFVRAVRRSAARAGADFLYGSFVTLRGGGVSNSAILVTPSGQSSRYGKVHLVPFGEFVPLRPLIGNVGMLTLVGIDQVSAGRPVLLPSSRGPLGVVICFESSDEALVRRIVNEGARLLVVVTNDGWFERTAASEQHFQISAMRAIENGTYVVQVSNNGISGIIDPRGRVLRRTDLWARTVMTGRVALDAEGTPYRAVGSLPLFLLCLGVLVGAALSAKRWQCAGADDKLPVDVASGAENG